MKYILLLLLTATLSTLLSAQNLLTTAERSDFQSTSGYTEVIDFMSRLAKDNDQARMEFFARSVEGREVPLVILADPMPSSYKDLENDDRLVVYLQANIHAGEVEGKEATQMLAQDLLKGELPGEILENVIVLICPIVNPDGNEKVSTENRTNQNGPVNGVGVRYNGQFLDMNRDAVKLETPELRGVVTEIFNKWDPAITVDCHTTNGSFHEEPVTFAWMVNPNGPRNLINYMRDNLMPSVHNTLRDKYGVENIYYGEFIDPLAMEKGWIYDASEPRYMVNYVGLRNRLSILNENYVYADFKTRVFGCYHLLVSILEYAAGHATEIKNMLSETDQWFASRHMTQPETDSFAIEYEVQPVPEKISIKAIETDTIPGVTGYWRYRRGEDRFTVTTDYYADYYPTASVKIPFAYLISVPDPEILDLLRTHGIKLERLDREMLLDVEQFNVTSFEGGNMPFQGHYMTRIGGEFESFSRKFPEGTYLVRTAQPLGSLAAYLLEPQSNDGLVTWNFFDQYIVKQWSSTFNPYPVFKLMSETRLISSPENSGYISPVHKVILPQAHVGSLEIDTLLLDSYGKLPENIRQFYMDARAVFSENPDADFSSPGIIESAANHDILLMGGPMLGNLKANSITMWLRPATNKSLTVKVSGPDGKEEKHYRLNTPQAGHEQRILLDDLEPDKAYHYYVFVDSTTVARGSFETAPEAGEGDIFRVTFGSGFHKIGLHNPNLVHAILKRDPQAMLLTGDIAVDDRENRINMHRSDYLLRDVSKAWRELAANVPLYATWDDHDYFNNDLSGIPEGFSADDREAVREVWHQNWNNPENKREGIYFNTRLGPVEVIMTDTRSLREGEHRGEYGSYLGKEQMKWLKKTLKNSDAPFKIITGGTMWSDYISKGKDSWGTWDTTAREEIFNFIEEENISGVLLVSGDRHGARAFTIPRKSGFVLHEFEVATLGGVRGPAAMAEDRSTQLFGYPGKGTIAFGEFTFDTTGEEPVVVFRLIDEKGNVLEEEYVRKREVGSWKLETGRKKNLK